MKIGILAFNNIRYCPYMNSYVEIFKNYGVEYDIIYFDRAGEGTLRDHIIPVRWNKAKHKIMNFLSFSRESKRIIRQNKYDLIVVLTTIPGVLLTGFLSKHYQNNYIIDIRDFTFENNWVYRKLENKLVKNAAMRVISAPGFKNFLPKSDYYLCHNTTYDFSLVEYPVINRKDRIIIGYVGSLAYAKQCKLLIDLVERDSRFSFFFYGNETTGTTIQDMIRSASCDRIRYFGKYEPSDKEGIIESIDILFNAYGNDSDKLIYAISNKFYDALRYGKPVITSPNTDMSRLLNVLSFDIDDKTKSLDKLFDWYISIDQTMVNEIIDMQSESIIKDQLLFEQAVKQVLDL